MNFMRKLYTIETNGPIRGLDGITGPLTTPTMLETDDVIKMLRQKYVIYQHNPVDLKEKVRVTLTNVQSINFKTTRAEATKERLHIRSVQRAESPMTVDVVKKEESSYNNNNNAYYNKHDKKNKHNNYQNNQQNNQAQTDTTESKPLESGADDFQKN